jgi:hypothetical protein
VEEEVEEKGRTHTILSSKFKKGRTHHPLKFIKGRTHTILK